MKRITSPILALLLALGALLIDGANHTVSARNQGSPNRATSVDSLADGGRFHIGYSPTLGTNLGLVLRIDGREAGGFTRGHIYQTNLRPGRHYISLSPTGKDWGDLQMTLDVRPGQTYSYIAKYNRYQVLLIPASLPR